MTNPSDLDLTATTTSPRAHRLCRSRTDRVAGGVCGGLGHYLRVDPLLLRVATVALSLATGLAALAYAIAWIVIPDEDETSPPQPAGPTSLPWLLGVVLVGLGVVLLLRHLVPWTDAAVVGPLLLLFAGGLILGRVGHHRKPG
jgi:phage shock protein C